MAHATNKFSSFSYLSLDVVSGALASMYFFKQLLHVELEGTRYVLLALVVWVIYTLDHLVDLRRSKEAPLSARRIFHWRHRMILGLLVVIAIVFGILGSFFWLGWGIELQVATCLGTVIAGSLGIIHYQGWFKWKEVSIALFYVIGVAWLPLLKASPLDLNWEVFLFLVFYVLLALLNLLMLTFLDREEDLVSGFGSGAQKMTTAQLQGGIRKLGLLLIITSLLAFAFLPSLYRTYSGILFLMTLAHYLIFFGSKSSENQKRIAMELSFSMPWILALF